MAGKFSTQFEPLKGKISPEEWEARVTLAACYRLMDKYGMTDMIYNHITARIAGTDDLLINLYGLLYKEITASSLVRITVEGEIVRKPDTDYGINKSGYVIHGCIHTARPDVQCVIHTHTRAGMAVSSMSCGLLAMTQTASRFNNHIGYHDFEGPAVDHGLLTSGASVPQAFNLMYQLEMSCRAQVDAMAAGTQLALPSNEVLEKSAHLYQPNVRRPYGELEWHAMLRLLEAEPSGYPHYAS